MRGLIVGGRAILVSETLELAWAERHVQAAPDLAWILGRYVSADPAGNSNGHIFALADLEAAVATIPHKGLNVNHEPPSVGVAVAAELIVPQRPASAMESAARPLEHPYVETLSALWRWYHKAAYEKVQAAHEEGRLFHSMEAAPQSLTCRGVGVEAGCGETFPYMGPMHDSYCEHMQKARARRVLNKPRFTANAVIVPPVRPGWTDADVTELSHLMEADMAEGLYEQIAGEFGHLDAREWEAMMAATLGVGGVRPDEPSVMMPNGTWPILTEDDVKRAVDEIGEPMEGDGWCEVRVHVWRRAVALGVADLIPESWKQETAAADDVGVISASGDYLVVYEEARDFSQMERMRLAKKGLALPGGEYPIVTVGDLRNAIAAVGRAKDQAKAIAHIKKRAAALGATNLLPADWR